jgi:dTDP-4-amino-4,6-dideoxygalactose transaminase
MCSHREAPYVNDAPRHDLRHSESAQDHAILLPIYAQMAEKDLVYVADTLKTELQRN